MALAARRLLLVVLTLTTTLSGVRIGFAFDPDRSCCEEMGCCNLVEEPSSCCSDESEPLVDYGIEAPCGCGVHEGARMATFGGIAQVGPPRDREGREPKRESSHCIADVAPVSRASLPEEPPPRS